MGCSNPHPHGQVWSLSEIPTIPARELESLRRYSQSEVAETGASKGTNGNRECPLAVCHLSLANAGRPCILCEYSYAELQLAEGDNRVVTYNEYWIAVVPWWATWPFEILCKKWFLCGELLTFPYLQ